MKKIIMLIAVMISAAAAASAAGPQINFDGRTTDAMPFREAVNLIQEKSAVVCHQVCYKDKDGKVICIEECTETAKGAGSDMAAVPAPTPVKNAVSDISSMSKEEQKKIESRLDSSIKTAIDYCNKNHMDDVRNNFAALLAHGTIKDKNDFVNNRAAKYVFPVMKTFGAEILEASSSQQKGGNPYCVAWGKQNVCVDKMVCKYTCVIVGATVATWGSVNGVWQIIIPAAVGTEVCKDVCANVPICGDVPYCTQWETEVM